MTSKIFNIGGMECAACSAAVHRVVSALDGVKKADVNLLENVMLCEYDESKVSAGQIISAVTDAGFTADEAKSQTKETEEKKEKGGTALTVSAVFLLLLMYVSMGHMVGLPLPKLLHTPLYSSLLQLILTLPVLIINRAFFISGIKSLRRGANMDTLVSLGSGSAFLYGVYSVIMIASGHTEYSQNLYFESSAMILTLVSVGKLLQHRAKKKTGASLAALIDLAPQNATVERLGQELTVPAAELKAGDIIIVKPGEAVPADGTVTEGLSSVDESSMTGESLPKEKAPGDTVMASSVNIGGYFKMKAVNVGADTALSKIIQSVRSSGATKARAARLADKISGIFVPVVTGIALVTLVIWLIAGKDFSFALNCAVSVLVISCPCALGLATPVAVTVGMGRSASDGVLFKTAESLEDLAAAKIFVFDKTGTLTKGKLKVSGVFPNGCTEKELISVAAAVESGSAHPLAQAVINKANEIEALKRTSENMGAEPGLGVYADINGETCRVGNARFMDKYGIVYAKSAYSGTSAYVSREDKFLGYITFEDEIRENAAKAIKTLTDAKVRTVLLTGDSEQAAELAAKKLGIKEIKAQVLPYEKEEAVRKLSECGTVVMVGDGINDAQALNAAHVGVAIGAGTDIAVDSADVVLLGDDIAKIADAYLFSRKTVLNIKENLFWAFFYNIIGIPIAAGALYPAFGILLSPMLAAAAMSLSSVFVVCNALRLYSGKAKTKKQ